MKNCGTHDRRWPARCLARPSPGIRMRLLADATAGRQAGSSAECLGPQNSVCTQPSRREAIQTVCPGRRRCPFCRRYPTVFATTATLLLSLTTYVTIIPIQLIECYCCCDRGEQFQSVS